MIEFISNMKYPGVLKARNHEELKASNRGTISWCHDTVFLAKRHVFELIISWHDFLKCGAILRRIWNTTRVKCQIVARFLQGVARFGFRNFFLFKHKLVSETRVTN